MLLDGDDVISSTKALTSADVTSGILEALEFILTDSGVDAQAIEAVMLGTTQFTNAVVERKKLSEVAAIRIGLPSGEGLPPKIGWPADISQKPRGPCLHGPWWHLVRREAIGGPGPGGDLAGHWRYQSKGIDTVAISAAFSPMTPQPELAVAEQLRAAIPGVNITCSHQIGRLGLLERENAALLNAALLKFSVRVAVLLAMPCGSVDSTVDFSSARMTAP